MRAHVPGLVRRFDSPFVGRERQSAELEFAESNLRRQQRLLRLGSAHKSDVTNAEEKLAELKAPKN